MSSSRDLIPWWATRTVQVDGAHIAVLVNADGSLTSGLRVRAPASYCSSDTLLERNADAWQQALNHLPVGAVLQSDFEVFPTAGAGAVGTSFAQTPISSNVPTAAKARERRAAFYAGATHLAEYQTTYYVTVPGLLPLHFGA